jgi:hypothetical protein
MKPHTLSDTNTSTLSKTGSDHDFMASCMPIMPNRNIPNKPFDKRLWEKKIMDAYTIFKGGINE